MGDEGLWDAKKGVSNFLFEPEKLVPYWLAFSGRACYNTGVVEACR
jgi:hypothetical protein